MCVLRIVFFLELDKYAPIYGFQNFLVAQKGTEWSRMAPKILFWCNMKCSYIYILVPVPSLGSVRLPIMCVGSIARQKLTDGYIAVCQTTSITLHYCNSHMAAAFSIL